MKSRIGLSAARQIFGRLTKELIEVKPLEAKLSKLMCNCYRYITFAIANQFHMLATDAGVDFAKATPAELVELQRSKNEWLVRMARR